MRSCCFAFVFFFIAAGASSLAEDASLNREVRRRFSKTQLLCLPASVVGEDVLCLIDTGASTTVLDKRFEESLKAAYVSRPVNIVTLSGTHRADVFEQVEISVTGRASRKLPATVVDLSTLRTGSLLPIEMVVGKNYLDGLHLLFADGFPQIETNVGATKIDVDWRPLHDRRGTPTIPIQFPVLGECEAVLDTGFSGTLVIEESVADALIRSSNAIELPKGGSIDASGERQKRQFLVREVAILGTVFKDIRVMSGTQNSIGTEVMRHATFHLDFAKNQYCIDRPTSKPCHLPIDASGLWVVWDQEEANAWKVMRVKDGSAGQKSGVSKGDSLIAIDAQQTDGMTCWDIREELSKSGEAVRLDLLRNGKALTVELALEHPFDYPPKWKPRAADADDFFESLQKDEAKK